MAAQREDLDLVPVKSRSDVFKVTFDYYTPRAHFALSVRDGAPQKVGQDYNKLEKKTKQEILKLVNAMISEYNFDGVFSIHCGTWTSTRSTFHGHICVNVNEYIDLFRSKKNDIPNWPSKDYVTREWMASKNSSHYEKNVRGYPFKDYFKEECQGIAKQARKDASEAKRNPKKKDILNYVTSSYKGFLVLYHPSEPRVGFVLDTMPQRPDDQLKAMDAMYQFAEVNHLTVLSGKGADKGCHVCVVLDTDARGFPLESPQRLLGFIQVSGTKFYKDFCPDNMKEIWAQDFMSGKEYKVCT